MKYRIKKVEKKDMKCIGYLLANRKSYGKHYGDKAFAELTEMEADTIIEANQSDSKHYYFKVYQFGAR